MYASLHNHTMYSNIRLLDAINRPGDLVDKAIRLGFKGIAITDHESLSCAVELLHIRDKIKKDNPDFKIIFGNEIYLVGEDDMNGYMDWYKNSKQRPLTQEEINSGEFGSWAFYTLDTNTMPKFRFYHFILWAKDAIGFQQLKELSSKAWGRSFMFKGQRRCPTFYSDIEEIVAKNKGHVMCATACLGSELAAATLTKNVSWAKKFVSWVINSFGKENVRFELQVSDSDDQIAYNRGQIKLSKALGIPYVITTDSHYLDKEDAPIHKAFLNSKQGDREVDSFYKYTYMMSEDEMREILRRGGVSDEETDEGFKNSAEVADLIEEYDFRHEIIVPKRKIPEFVLSRRLYAFGDKYPHIKMYYDSPEEQDRYLMYQIENGLIEKRVNVTDKELARLEEELDILWFLSERLKQPLSAYLNLCQHIIDITWKVSICAPGRGSACGYYINYLIGITQVNPFDNDLWCQRFLNKERVEMPDVDYDSQPEKTTDIIALLREEFGEENVLNCATFKTESLKSAILTCGRGLGFNNDDMQTLAGMVPAHRGKTYNLEQCLKGDEGEGFEPVPGFETKLKSYPGLFEAVQKIEGLSTNASIHASALYIFNNGYLAQNSLMMAPNGTKITAFTMHDSDEMGALKMDLLRTDAMSKIAKCLELLLKDHQITWQGSLKQTYDKYIHPDVIDYTDESMWIKMSDGAIRDLFQMDSPVGQVAMHKAQPRSVAEMGEVNAIMRLQSEGEQPIDRYMRFHNNIQEWYDEMTQAGLTEHEQEILKKYLSKSYGVSGTQEVMMKILMDPEIANFTLEAANFARGAVSKKNRAKIEKFTEWYWNSKAGARKEFLKYVWDTCITPQLGYAFNLIHTISYSVIAVQEANLATHYNPLYWACACLCCNAGNTAQSLDSDEDEESDDQADETPQDPSNEPLEASQKKKRAAPNYGKIAKAIADAQMGGVEIGLPDINSAQDDFVPDVKNNRILYSLRVVNAVSDPVFDEIMAKRPFSSLQDFLDRMETPSSAQVIGLIKAGCFDSLEGKSRRTILRWYVNWLAEREYPIKENLTASHIKKAIATHMPLDAYKEQVFMINFKIWIDAHQLDPSDKKRYILTDSDAVTFFKRYYMSCLVADKDEYSFIPAGIAVKKSALEREHKKFIQPLKDYFLSPAGAEAFAKHMRASYATQVWTRDCSGSQAQWEMEQMCFYHDKHELAGVSEAAYGVSDFSKLPETPRKTSYTNAKGEKKDSYDMTAIMGTIVNVENGRKSVWLLTTHGVVTVKFYAEAFNRYKNPVSKIDPKTGKKTVIDRAWLKRGEKILVYGYRREDAFVARAARMGSYTRMLCRIDGVAGSNLNLTYSRGGE